MDCMISMTFYFVHIYHTLVFLRLFRASVAGSLKNCLSVDCRISGHCRPGNEDNVWRCENDDGQLVCRRAGRWHWMAALLGLGPSWVCIRLISTLMLSAVQLKYARIADTLFCVSAAHSMGNSGIISWTCLSLCACVRRPDGVTPTGLSSTSTPWGRKGDQFSFVCIFLERDRNWWFLHVH